MANEEHLEILLKGVDIWNSWRRENQGIKPDLSNADLRGANLRGIDLSQANPGYIIGANLRGVNLSGADLFGSNFTWADLRGANLRRANLQKSNFYKATLAMSDLTEANLYESSLIDTILNKTDLRGANLGRADLYGAELIQAALNGANLYDANLHRAILVRANLSGANLNGANLYDANLHRAILVRANLSGANLYGAHLIITDLPESYRWDFLRAYRSGDEEQHERIHAGEGTQYELIHLGEGTTFDKFEIVKLGASAPQSVSPGGEFTARFVAYIKTLEKAMQELLANLSPRSLPYLGLKTCQWRQGTRVKVRFYFDWYLATDDSNWSYSVSFNLQEEFIWGGDFSLIDFDVKIPKRAAEGTTVLKFDVSVDEFTIAKLRMDLEISSKKKSSNTNIITDVAAQTAFASYAKKDRIRVLDRLSSVSISAGLDIFLDCLSLRANDKWKQRLAEEIERRELFLLFWSIHAKRSKWVNWELKTALEKKDKRFMQIHPLEPDLEPPRELQDVHSGDPYVIIREGCLSHVQQKENSPKPH